MNRLDALLQFVDGGLDVGDSRFLHQLSIISVQVMAEMMSVDKSCQLFSVGDEFLWTKIEALDQS